MNAVVSNLVWHPAIETSLPNPANVDEAEKLPLNRAQFLNL